MVVRCSRRSKADRRGRRRAVEDGGEIACTTAPRRPHAVLVRGTRWLWAVERPLVVVQSLAMSSLIDCRWPLFSAANEGGSCSGDSRIGRVPAGAETALGPVVGGRDRVFEAEGRWKRRFIPRAALRGTQVLLSRHRVSDAGIRANQRPVPDRASRCGWRDGRSVRYRKKPPPHLPTIGAALEVCASDTPPGRDSVSSSLRDCSSRSANQRTLDKRRGARQWLVAVRYERPGRRSSAAL